jgi:6-phosphogluconolactonase
MTSISRRSLLAAGSVAPLLAQSGGGGGGTAHGRLLYIGTYTKGSSKGVYAAYFNPSTGEMTSPKLVAETPNPTFLALSPDRRYLYAVNEVENYKGTHDGSLVSYKTDRSGGPLTQINVVDSNGSGPCHVAVDQTGHTLITANYGSGSAASYHIDDNGRMSDAVSKLQFHGHGADKERQAGPHAHCATVSPDNRFVLINDLGLDKIHVYHLNASTAELTPNQPPAWNATPASGPRHLVFHPNHRIVYSTNEMSSTVDVLSWDPSTGTLKTLQSLSTLPPDFKGENSTAEIAVDSKGKFVYVSNRGKDSIAVFSVNPQNFHLTLLANTSTEGKTPRHFTLDPSEKWILAGNEEGHNIVILRRDPSTGLLSSTGKSYRIDGAVCLLFV